MPPGTFIRLEIKRSDRFCQPGHGVTGRRIGCRNHGAGWDFVHVAVEAATRFASVGVSHDARKNCTTGFLLRALRWFRDHGIRAEQVWTGHSRAFRARRFAKAPRPLAIRHVPTLHPKDKGQGLTPATASNRWRQAARHPDISARTGLWIGPPCPAPETPNWRDGLTGSTDQDHPAQAAESPHSQG